MSRLYDRVLTEGCAPLNAAHLYAFTRADSRELTRDELGRQGLPTDDEFLDTVTTMPRPDLERLTSPVTLDSELAEAVVLSAEECADYWATLPAGTNMTDLVGSAVPPFDTLFVEFQHRPNVLGAESWGVLFYGMRREDDGWDVVGQLVAEWRKGRPVGPVASWVLPLDSEGMLAPGDNEGYGSIYLRPTEIPDVPAEAQFDFGNSLIAMLAPAVFAISLMHCKNVDRREIEPPERVSRKHERKHGRPLSRYYVLDIEPMRRVLDAEGKASTQGLRQALHICRGHFKTYTPEAPLLGKHTGTYWWAPQVRGSLDEGIVEKDYRIRLDQGLGREYVEVDEHPEIAPTAAEHVGVDPDLGSRGLRAHNQTQNLLAAAVRAAGYEPRRPRPDEPQYDLAWQAAETIWVAEVKSITTANEERQLRIALGQVLRYRHLLSGNGCEVRALVAVERAPTDPSWVELLAAEQIRLVWPGAIELPVT